MAKNPDADLLVQIGAAEGSANRLRRLWETERASIEAAPVEKELFKSLANGLIEAGEAWLGLAVCEAGLTALSRHSQRNQLSIPLRCLSALAQARLGAQPEANRIAKQLYTEHPQDVGIICGCWRWSGSELSAAVGGGDCSLPSQRLLIIIKLLAPRSVRLATRICGRRISRRSDRRWRFGLISGSVLRLSNWN
jgi:hypothetical protein